MNNVQWKTAAFHQCSIDQLFDILQLRVDVFVVEQECAYPELDEYDRHPEVRHLSGYDESDQLVAYTRLLPPGLRYSEVNLGRFLVKANMRKQGIGQQLLQSALQESSRCWPNTSIRILAQEYLQKFYEQYEFVRVSDVYLEDGIPHVEMLKKTK